MVPPVGVYLKALDIRLLMILVKQLASEFQERLGSIRFSNLILFCSASSAKEAVMSLLMP